MTIQQRTLTVSKEIDKLRKTLGIQVDDLGSTRQELQAKESELRILSLDETEFGSQSPMSEVVSRWPSLNDNSYQKIVTRLHGAAKL